MTTEEIILEEFLKATSPWKEHIVIGGGFAPIIYHKYLSKSISETPPVGTTDIDTLLPRRLVSHS